MPVGVFLLQCLCFICSLDFNSFLANLDTISQLDWSFDSSLNYDPVREAAAQNAEAGTSSSHTTSTGGGPSQPQGGENPSADGVNRDTDTKRLGDYLSECPQGNSVYNCGLENGSRTINTTPQKLYLSRIWAHVKAEHPEFANNYIHGGNTTVIDDTLINNIYSLKKNYPGYWP